MQDKIKNVNWITCMCVKVHVFFVRVFCLRFHVCYIGKSHRTSEYLWIRIHAVHPPLPSYQQFYPHNVVSGFPTSSENDTMQSWGCRTEIDTFFISIQNPFSVYNSQFVFGPCLSLCIFIFCPLWINCYRYPLSTHASTSYYCIPVPY